MPLEYSTRNKTKHSLQIIEQGRNLNHHETEKSPSLIFHIVKGHSMSFVLFGTIKTAQRERFDLRGHFV